MKSRLIGKVAYITTKDSMYCGEWGIIHHYDGEYYHIGIAGSRKDMLIFERKEFYIPRKKK